MFTWANPSLNTVLLCSFSRSFSLLQSTFEQDDRQNDSLKAGENPLVLSSEYEKVAVSTFQIQNMKAAVKFISLY